VLDRSIALEPTAGRHGWTWAIEVGN